MIDDISKIKVGDILVYENGNERKVLAIGENAIFLKKLQYGGEEFSQTIAHTLKMYTLKREIPSKVYQYRYISKYYPKVLNITHKYFTDDADFLRYGTDHLWYERADETERDFPIIEKGELCSHTKT